ncbi:MAG TPA: glutamyl-tRNA reductase [Candidatus Binataceae bacterium]|nr:glutamyl-tRNA reductase [Candidatus Binataceae bacterium]
MRETLFIFGVSHRTAPVAVRERLAYAEGEIVAALTRLRQAAPAIHEVALISTCNRVEIMGVTEVGSRATDEATEFLAGDRGVDPLAFRPALYQHEARDAVRHLFRVGASLDSMVVGEPQILGQLKNAYAQAAEAGTAGLVLHRAFHKAFSVAKRVRKSTLIGHGAVSVSSAAVGLAAKIFDTLADKTVMLIGAGQMAELTARNLKRLGIQSLLITSRTFDHAVALARKLDGTAVPFDNFHPYLKIADVVIGSISAAAPVIGPDEFEGVIRERRYRPVFMIDLGVPRNFDPRLNALENVYLYDIDDLSAVVQESVGDREREAEKAEEIVDLEVANFLKWLDGLDLVPAIKDIRSSVEQLRELELERHRAWLASLAPGERERIESMTRGLVNKLLHRILSGIREGRSGIADGVFAAEIARRLFRDELAIEGGVLIDDDGDEDDDL